MENVIQFGIYKRVLLLSIVFLVGNLFAQDYYVDLDGNKHEIEILEWNINRVLCKVQEEEIELTPKTVKSIYRDIAAITYVSIDSLLSNNEHQSFFIPSIESIDKLSIDNIKDEHFEIWSSGIYFIFEVKSLGKNFSKIEDASKKPIELNDVFIYSAKAGFNKIVSKEIEEEQYKILLSRYLSSASLKDSIFNDIIKLKPKKFLNFFNENESPLTAILYNDKDRAAYYIQALKDEGALILLLNLNKRKIQLYRDAGNEKLAKNLEENLLKDNLSYAYGFLDKNVFNFCKVYITDAKNIQDIINGERNGLFLNKNLEIDSSITMTEDIYLFAREGVLYETQLADPIFNAHKKTITSSPVVQDAMVIYDIDNIQVIEPFPNYVRNTTSRIGINKKVAKSQKNKGSSENNTENFNEIIERNMKESGIESFNYNAFGIVSSFNVNFYNYYKNVVGKNLNNTRKYLWNYKNISNGDSNWYAPSFKYYHPSSK